MADRDDEQVRGARDDGPDRRLARVEGLVAVYGLRWPFSSYS